MNYFGTYKSLPPRQPLQAGLLSCLYEDGNLRYIKSGNDEVVRMLYSAVRDVWGTAVARITDEKIQQSDNSFFIQYSKLYELADMCYKGDFTITGTENSELIFEMNGVALSDFMSNRIGLCALLPLNECISKPCSILHSNGQKEDSKFPEQVAPHQPFKDICGMEWNPADNCNLFLQFEGEIFEGEDHRNWTDASFKIYGTPLSKPYPVAIKKGDTISQKITLRFNKLKNDLRKTISQSPSITITDTKIPFPAIGYEKSSFAGKLNGHEIVLLKQIPFNHYRVEIGFEPMWKNRLKQSVEEAFLLNTKIELVVFFEEPEKELLLLLEELKNHANTIGSLLVLHKGFTITSSHLWNKVCQPLKNKLPGVRVGAGTDFHFAEWNREYVPDSEHDFIAYSINPQMHAFDIKSLIENVEAQKHTVDKARLVSSGKPIHITPVTLKERLRLSTGIKNTSVNHDERQSTLFNAAWTLLSIRYLAGVASITYFETTGINGLMNENPYPVYDYLKVLQNFKPIFIRDIMSTHPLQADALVVENSKGELACFLVNFTENKIEIALGNYGTQTVPPCSILMHSLSSPIHQYNY